MLLLPRCYFGEPIVSKAQIPLALLQNLSHCRMFKKLTKFIAKQIDPNKKFVPVESIADNEHFRPLCLLTKKRKPETRFHRDPYYQQTGFTLQDVLLPGEDGESTECRHQSPSICQFTLTKTSTDEADGGLDISHDPASADLHGGASLSNTFSVKPQKRRISLESLEALRRERKVNMDHSFIQQLRRRDINLYVVTETLEASEETVYKKATKADGGLKAKFYATFHGKGTREDKQTIVIPKGCTLTFRTMPLHIGDGAWHLDYFPEEAEKSAADVTNGPSQGKLVRQRDVELSLRNFTELSPDMMLFILNTIRAVMRENNHHQEPSQKAQIHSPLLQNRSHSRMFKKLNKFVVNQMDPQEEFVPVESIADNEDFRPLCLLKKKRKSETIFHPAPYYQRTGFTLHDVLLPGVDGENIEPLLQDSRQFPLTKTWKDQADGGLSISCDPVNLAVHGGSTLSKEFTVKPQKKSISQQSLEALRRERKINMDHSFIQQQQRRDINLYVVTEILEASEETVYKKATKADRGLKAKFYAKFRGKGNTDKNKDIVIPKGCTLAFRAIPLHIRDGVWDLDYFLLKAVGNAVDVTNDESMGKLEEVVREVEYRCQIFTTLSPDLLLVVFIAIKAAMRDKKLLQELSQKMEDIPEERDGYELKTESPELKELFSTLQHSPKDCLHQLAEGITYILDALHELMDDQLLLLLESLERKILSQQLNLVENLLKHDLDDKMCNFQVDASLLAFPHKEEQMLTMELVEMSGVQLHEDGSAVSLDQSFEAVAALFVALYALKLLSGSK
uniref:Gasdermin-A n=1 Tax=Catharus ustulatus TaxID=91951 RepID=A0A8C3UP15_CATUS